MNVTFHQDGLTEFEEAARWYRDRSLNAAQNFQLAIAQAIQQIVSARQHFPLTVLGHRKPFCTVFRISSSFITSPSASSSLPSPTAKGEPVTGAPVASESAI